MAASNEIRLTLETGLQDRQENFIITDVIIGGWTGRDRARLEAHIEELAALGVARPARTPCFYRVGVNLLTTAGNVQVVGGRTSGEAEYVLVRHAEEYWIGLGSDHTDRAVEAYNVTISKQCCPKPFSPAVWRYVDVKGHWDALTLRSYRHVGGERILYQEGPVSAMIDPMDLADRYATERLPLGAGQVMFGGTLPVIGELTGAPRFEIELDDPVLGRKLTHAYDVEALPDVA